MKKHLRKKLKRKAVAERLQWKTRFFARHQDAAPGVFTEFAILSVSARGAQTDVEAYVDAQCLGFLADRGLAEFGLLMPHGKKFMSEGFLWAPSQPRFVIDGQATIDLTLEHCSPWIELVDKPSHLP